MLLITTRVSCLSFDEVFAYTAPSVLPSREGLLFLLCINFFFLKISPYQFDIAFCSSSGSLMPEEFLTRKEKMLTQCKIEIQLFILHIWNILYPCMVPQVWQICPSWWFPDFSIKKTLDYVHFWIFLAKYPSSSFYAP